MFYRPDIVILLWMLPVTCFIIAPALWITARVLLQAVDYSRLGDVRGFLEISPPLADSPAEGERRRATRVRIEGPRMGVARRIQCCRTHVENISVKGIRLACIPEKMFRDHGQFRVVFRTKKCSFSMMVQPRWKRKTSRGYILGGEIEKLPAGWEQFVNSLSSPVQAMAA